MKPLKNFRALPAQAQIVIALFALAGIVSATWTLFSGTVPHPGRLLMLVMAGAVTAHTKVKLTKTSSLSLLTAVVMLSLMLEGLLAAVVVGVAGVTIQAFLPSRKFVMHRFVFNAAMVVLAVHAASIPYYWVISHYAGLALLSHVLGIGAASLTYYLGNSLSVSLIVAATECKSAIRVWQEHFMLAAPSFLIAGLLSAIVAEALATSLVEVAIALPLLFIAYRFMRMAGKYTLVLRAAA